MSSQPLRKAPDRVPSPFKTSMSAIPIDIPVSRTSSFTPSRPPPQPRGSVSSTRESPLFPPAKALSASPKPVDLPNATVDKPCENCESAGIPTWHCSYCDMTFCDPCWAKQGPHKPGRTGPDGLPHEKADLRIVKRLKEILTPSSDPQEQHTLHLEDEDTTWFGIARDSDNQPIFQDYGRYATIIANSSTGEFKVRYPQLISFIGQTGAGKSTLVKMLIDQQERIVRPHHTAAFASPVVGSVRNENVPTSGDVHLYGDPKTYLGQNPVLYADCEGLEGGENMPISAQFCNMGPTSNRKRADSNPEHRKLHKIAKVARGTQRDITWANSPEKQKRQYAVTELYPRLLYTFSDVIVFVLRNPKTFESSVLAKLLSWASASMEKSLNQPTLPHAVIALNATDMEVDPAEWESEHATKVLMSTVAGAIHRDSTYRGLADYWIGQGRRVNTMKDLLECYYSSVTVVRIPIKGRYMKIDSQVEKLHAVITKKGSESFKARRRSRMLSNAEELNIYLQCAFDHFSQDLDTPFNFMDVAFKINPIPLDFGGNILKLAVAIKNCRRFTDPRNIFKELSYMVASCVMLDCVRQSLKGPPDQILEKGYLDYCDNALDDFCAIFWPCTFTNKKGQRCVNVKECHTKGHQNNRGAIIGTGIYESNFTWETFADDWLRYLQDWLSQFQQKVGGQMGYNPDATELVLASNLHHSNVNWFYQRLGGAENFVSHSACFCCLREMAEHPLPCGHILCTPCVKGYGKAQQGLYTLSACPLHEHNTLFATPWQVFFKPPLAGVRILSLDGGGIRGVVELEVLRSIEQALGGRIPIQEFFDLIVGTSTGGIIALGLGVENWSVDKCMSHFKKLVGKAFTPKLAGMRLGTSKYRTRPLEEGLKTYFKDVQIFGGIHETSKSHPRKVAVTAACETGEQAVIFTNYNRAEDGQVSYRMERPDDPNNELKLWEAARATSAAPTFFKPFVNSRTKEAYLDGAVFHNNPVRIANYESKLIWPDVEECHPDILLSIGTGHNGQDTVGYIDSTQVDRRRLHTRDTKAKSPKLGERQRSFPALWAFPEVTQWLNVLFKRVDNILDSEQIWKSFRNDVIGTSSYAEMLRYERFNPKVGFTAPKMDDKGQVDKLHDDVRERLSKPQMQSKIHRIAHRLIASCFYFEKTGPPREAEDHYIVQGTICCRFTKSSDYLRSLGGFIQKHQLHSFQPYFKIRELMHEETSQYIKISPEIIEKMTKFGYFEIGSIVIPISLQMGLISIELNLTDNRRITYPISGFPRSLTSEELLKRTTSPSSPDPERVKVASRRGTLRKKRGALHRPTFSTESSANSVNEDEAFPDSPGDVNEWVRRREEAARPTPRAPTLVEKPGVFELEGSSTIVEIDEDDVGLGVAMERSLFENQGYRPPDTEQDELARVLELSKIIR